MARNAHETLTQQSNWSGPATGTHTRSLAGRATIGSLVALVLALWTAAVVVLGVRGAFVAPTGTPPIPIALGFAVPLLVFFGALRASVRFREFLLQVDLPLMTAVQAWRFAGFAFIALFVHGLLPGSFAWPAGLGDMAIGVTAPFFALAIIRRPELAAGRLFAVWNLLGILDLVVAVGDGALNQVLSNGAAGEITTTPMAQMPLVLIPALLVPIFLMLHVAALLQARRLAHTTPRVTASPSIA